ncbi:hypothetical protein AGMMS49965_23730 [Bacteroidia bacterium]|nr:hypothetical protein AGMMS49965_23730 [Bacteroidia bacterium]
MIYKELFINTRRYNMKAQTKKTAAQREPENIGKHTEASEQSWWKWVFIALAAIIFVAMPLMSLDAGNSGDEDLWQFPQGLRLYDYYTSLGENTDYLNEEGLTYSGYAFDTFTAFVVKIFGIDDYMTARHVCNALVGAFLMLFVGLLAKLIGGWRAGCMALLLIFFSPHIVGQSFNNPKDIPFAAFAMGAIYYIAWFIKEYPKPMLKTSLKMGVMMGAAIGIRPGGFLFFAYFGLFVLVYYCIVNTPKQYFCKGNRAILKKIFAQAAVVLGAMLGVMFILWPYALRDPLHNIISSFKTASHFNVNLFQIFEGKTIWSDNLPWYYTLKYIGITSPIAVLLGGGVQLFAAHRQPKGYFWTFVLLFCFAFPLFWIVYTKANVYGGWRHSMFVYPTLVVAAALGFNSLVNWAKNKKVKIAFTVLPIILLFDPLIFTVRNHPYEYTYFNRFVGGAKGAFGNYEMDYYDHTTREASEWILADVAKNGAPDPTRKTRIVAWHPSSVNYFFRNDTARFSIGFVRWSERNNSDWDYAIFPITGIDPFLLRSKKAFPPKNTACQIKVDGVPLGLVLKREDRSSYYRHIALQQGNFTEAKTQLQKALEYDAYDEQALYDLIQNTLATGKPENIDKAMDLTNYWLDFHPNDIGALYMLGEVYCHKGDFANALLTANTITKLYPHNIEGLWIAAKVYEKQNDFKSAEVILNKILTIERDYKPAYELLLEIATKLDNQEAAQQLREKLNSL